MHESHQALRQGNLVFEPYKYELLLLPPSPKGAFGCQSLAVILGYKFQPHTPTTRSIRTGEGGFQCLLSA